MIKLMMMTALCIAVIIAVIFLVWIIYNSATDRDNFDDLDW